MRSTWSTWSAARVGLRRAGATRYEGLCPFCDERTPSFAIDPAERRFYCFGCGEGGDGFKFVQLTERKTPSAGGRRPADRGYGA
jgi:DNA primase